MTSFNRNLGFISAALLVFLAGCASSGGVEEAPEVEAPETSAEVQEVVVEEAEPIRPMVSRQDRHPHRRDGCWCRFDDASRRFLF